MNVGWSLIFLTSRQVLKSRVAGAFKPLELGAARHYRGQSSVLEGVDADVRQTGCEGPDVAWVSGEDDGGAVVGGGGDYEGVDCCL